MVRSFGTLLVCLLCGGCWSDEGEKARAASAPESRPTEARDATASKPQSAAQEPYLTLAVDEVHGVPLRAFGKIAECATGRPIGPLPADLRSHAILFRGTQNVRTEEMFSFYQAMLFRDGLVCVPSRQGSGFEVQRLKQQDWRLAPFSNVRWVSPEELAAHKDETDVKILTAVLVKRTKPVEAARQLHGKVPWSLEIGVAAENMLILFQGSGAEVYQARELLRKVDVKR